MSPEQLSTERFHFLESLSAHKNAKFVRYMVSNHDQITKLQQMQSKIEQDVLKDNFKKEVEWINKHSPRRSLKKMPAYVLQSPRKDLWEPAAASRRCVSPMPPGTGRAAAKGEVTFD